MLSLKINQNRIKIKCDSCVIDERDKRRDREWNKGSEQEREMEIDRERGEVRRMYKFKRNTWVFVTRITSCKSTWHMTRCCCCSSPFPFPIPCPLPHPLPRLAHSCCVSAPFCLAAHCCPWLHLAHRFPVFLSFFSFYYFCSSIVLRTLS